MLCSDAIKRAARESQFGLVGLAPADRLDPAPLREWLAAGMAGCLDWMAETEAKRLDPRCVLPNCRTVVALGCCFLTEAHRAPSPIALYARGRDYHHTMRDRLRALRRRLLALEPSLRTYACCDSGPVMEKAWAARAGLGWIGKNGMLITQAHGSHVVLAVMLLDRDVDVWGAPHPERCGRCTRCLEGCPTRAIVRPGLVDSRRCLSCQTIEDRGPYAPELRPHAAGLAYGCDLCQRVCPWNRPAHACDDARFVPRAIASLSLRELALLDRASWAEQVRGTAVTRAHYDGLRRNALVALGAQREAAGDPPIAALVDDPSPLVAEAARWAVAQGRDRGAPGESNRSPPTDERSPS